MLPKQLLGPTLTGVWARGASQKVWDPLLISTTAEGSDLKFGIQLGLGNIIQKLLLRPKMAWVWARENPTNFRVLIVMYQISSR